MRCGCSSLQSRPCTNDVLPKPPSKSGNVDYGFIDAALEDHRGCVGQSEVPKVRSKEVLLILVLVRSSAEMNTLESTEEPRADETGIWERRNDQGFGRRREESTRLVPVSRVEFRNKEPTGWRRRRLVGHLKEPRYAQSKFCCDVIHGCSREGNG